MLEENESLKKSMKRKLRNVIVTGGAGFIGSHVVKTLNRVLPDTSVYIVDCLTYAGSLKNVAGTKSQLLPYDIRSKKSIKELEGLEIDAIIHLAAESHVDRSIEDPTVFVETNVNGTVNLLNLALKYRERNPDFIFYHISTDEVFGTLGFDDGPFNENRPYDPHSPYSASKAASDHFVRAYGDTYGLNTLISNCSNNYGPNQYPEKLIPVVIKSLIERKPIPIYGQGENIRDWMYVEDHAEAIVEILQRGRFGETYCIGGDCELSNLDLVKRIILEFDKQESTYSMELISFVKDRPGHDLRYSIDHSKLTRELGWNPRYSLNYGLTKTVSWYIEFFREYIH